MVPRIFDNIDERLVDALRGVLSSATRADFCVGYFNLRGWRLIDEAMHHFSGEEGHQCRLLVGMQRLPQDELSNLYRVVKGDDSLDNSTVARLKARLAEDFRQQLMIGSPTNEDETGLHRLREQLAARKVVVRLYLRTTLHAKLYLAFRNDESAPLVGFLGSSNLTLSGLAQGGELNVDVLDQDAATKLARWFEDRWNDRWCVDITDDLIAAIEGSWARSTSLSPYEVYVKMAYHLSEDARAGLSEFRIPPEFGDRLFEYQTAAVKIAARHLNQRGGVLIGDVVGLGKTLMATALAKIFQDDYLTDTLIICPKNLVSMWSQYVTDYRLLARVVATSNAIRDLPELRRYRLVIIDESQNLRNREGKTYRVIRDYIQQNESMCVLLSATPYNKTYLDLSSQLRLFIPEDKDIGVRPENLLRELGETEFIRRYQAPVRSLAAFEKSEHADDWRELMRLFMVRRTRSFIKENYAEVDAATGRPFLPLQDGTRAFFPSRVPRTVRFTLEEDVDDQYSLLFSEEVVGAINGLNLPRYGLGNYVDPSPAIPLTAEESEVVEDLGKAGKRLMGFCRTNLFKRLESSGAVFLSSLKNHVLRNYLFLHALENGLPLPIGTQDPGRLDTSLVDSDIDRLAPSALEGLDDEMPMAEAALFSDAVSRAAAEDVYAIYAERYRSRFKWIRSDVFAPDLAVDLRADIEALLGIIARAGVWDASSDRKLAALRALLDEQHPHEKVLVFSQFADTVRYLAEHLTAAGVRDLAPVTGDSDDPTELAWRFSPVSNDREAWAAQRDPLRVLIATDVLSEGQNLQDAHVVVNFDLPWAIVRLIQRAGRVDRIGQKAEEILCYSFMPADGVERLIRIRSRVSERLSQNAEVVGTDEAFFEDEVSGRDLVNLYHEKSGVLDGEVDGEVDLVSLAYQVWKNAVDADPGLLQTIPTLPNVVYSAKVRADAGPPGVLAYMRTSQGNDALAWIDEDGTSVTESQFTILKAAECLPETPVAPRSERHHLLVGEAVRLSMEEERLGGGQLGRPSGARFKTYERLKRHAANVAGTLFDTTALARALEEIYRFPLQSSARDTLNRQLRAGIDDMALAELVLGLREDGRLSLVREGEAQSPGEPQIVCSLGLIE